MSFRPPCILLEDALWKISKRLILDICKNNELIYVILFLEYNLKYTRLSEELIHFKIVLESLCEICVTWKLEGELGIQSICKNLQTNF